MQARDVLLPRDIDAVDGRVPRNATLETLLRRHELSAEFTAGVVDAMRGVFNPREIRAEQAYRLTRSLDGLFREFRYQIDTDRLLRVVARRAPGDGAPPDRATSAVPAFDVEVVSLPKDVEIDVSVRRRFRARRRRSWARSLRQARPCSLRSGWRRFSVARSTSTPISSRAIGSTCCSSGSRATNEFVGYGAIKGAVLVNDSRRIVAVGFTDTDGRPAWYDEDGRSLKRQFLQSPLPFDPRVTSRFSYRRLHPVHGTTRAHLGVDYGAPAGTRVNAVASGVVELAGWAGEGGRVVRLRHAGGYQTVYLHLSAIGPGIRPGVRVEQGDSIGRVGSSGTATGPHLDYRIIKNGTYVESAGRAEEDAEGGSDRRRTRARRSSARGTRCSRDFRRVRPADVAIVPVSRAASRTRGRRPCGGRSRTTSSRPKKRGRLRLRIRSVSCA